MMQHRIAIGFAAILLIASTAASWAQQPAAPTATVLHLTQVATQIIGRDRLTIDLRAEADGTDPRRVQADVNRRMTSALAKAHAVAGVEISTGNYNTYQTSAVVPAGTPAPAPQWHTTQTLTLVSTTFDVVLALAGQLQADGLLLSGMHFDVAPKTLSARQHALTDQALQQLMVRAGEIAAALRLKVGHIQSLHVGNVGQPGGGPRPFVMAARAAAPTPPAAEAGDTEISVSVDADIALVPSR